MTEESEVSKGRPDENLALTKFKEAIENQAKEKTDTILAEAKAQAKEIIKKSKKEIALIKSETITKAENEAKLAKTREVSRKKLSLKMDFLDAREQVIDEILIETKSKLQTYTQSKEYAEYLNRDLIISGKSLGGGNIIIAMRSDDKSHLSKESLAKISKEIYETTGVETELSVSDEDLTTIGGFKLIRSDGRLFIDNTFEAKLDRNKAEIRVSILDLMED